MRQGFPMTLIRVIVGVVFLTEGILKLLYPAEYGAGRFEHIGIIYPHILAPLVGVVETYWLPFPFTMNWRFTRPGMISFTKGEPFCFLFPVPHTAIDDTQPLIKSIQDEPDLMRQYQAWGDSRNTFLNRLNERDSEAAKQGWQRDYFRGRTPEGHLAPDSHVNRRRLKTPRKAEKGE